MSKFMCEMGKPRQVEERTHWGSQRGPISVVALGVKKGLSRAYDFKVEVTNRFKGLNLIECLKNYG